MLAMRTSGWIGMIVVSLLGCGDTPAGSTVHRKALAERFFRGVYGCQPSVVPELGGDSILISYPIFEELFDTPSIRGSSDVEQFATGFCSRWKDAEITIHEAIAEANHVVLLWSFQARNVASGQRSSWGGISVFQFDDSGKIVAEVGEESAPGPIERWTVSGTAR